MSYAIIPARGGSRRIPRKNIRLFHGLPMIAYAIRAAQDSGMFRHVYVSTEDAEIAGVATQHGALVIDRPQEYAQNEVGTQEVMRHAVATLNVGPIADVCCIYPCTPLLTPDDLRAGVPLARDGSYVIAVNDEHGGDIGWFYCGRGWYFRDGLPLWRTDTRVYPVESVRAIDINTEDDWRRAEAVYQQLHRRAA